MKRNKTGEEESAYESKAQYYPFKPSKFALLMFLLNEYIFFKICMPMNPIHFLFRRKEYAGNAYIFTFHKL
jgi:hypothetical protein